MKCNFSNKTSRNMGRDRINDIAIGRGKMHVSVPKHNNPKWRGIYRRCYKLNNVDRVKWRIAFIVLCTCS